MNDEGRVRNATMARIAARASNAKTFRSAVARGRVQFNFGHRKRIAIVDGNRITRTTHYGRRIAPQASSESRGRTSPKPSPSLGRIALCWATRASRGPLRETKTRRNKSRSFLKNKLSPMTSLRETEVNVQKFLPKI